MDEETKAAFADVKVQFDGVKAQFDDVRVQFSDMRAQFDGVRAQFSDVRAQSEAMMTRMNDGFERVLNEITGLKTDFQNTKGFLLEDAIMMGRRMLSIEDRLSALERKKP